MIVPYFTGQSLLAHSRPTNSHVAFEIDITILTTEPSGVLLFAAQDNTGEGGDYFSLSLSAGVPTFQFNLGSGHREVNTQVAVNDGVWHVLTISGSGQVASLEIDGVQTGSVQVSGDFQEFNLLSPLFVGGVTDYTFLPDTVSQSAGFIGCIRDLQYDEESIEIVADALYGVDIEQCSEPVCPYVSCLNGGNCTETAATPGFVCECAPGFTGQFCETPVSLCTPGRCQFGGICLDFPGNYRCLCPLERGGRNCEQSKISHEQL